MDGARSAADFSGRALPPSAMSLVRFRSHWMSASRGEILKAVIDPSHAPEGAGDMVEDALDDAWSHTQAGHARGSGAAQVVQRPVMKLCCSIERVFALRIA